MTGLVSLGLTLIVLAVLVMLIVAILRLPRPAGACGRCNAIESIGCWRGDCPFHEGEEARR